MALACHEVSPFWAAAPVAMRPPTDPAPSPGRRQVSGGDAQGLDPGAGGVRARRPQPAIDRLLQAVRDFGEGGGVMGFDKGARVVVLQKGLFYQIEVVVAHGTCRGREGEKVIDCRRDLERALVAVTLDPVDPLGI